MTGRQIHRLAIFLFTLIAMSLSGKVVLAQQPTFQVVVTKTTIAEGERFRMEFRLNNKGSHFTPPKFEGFRILAGPNPGSNKQNINGRISYSTTFSYVLMALKEGKYTIPPASIKFGSEVIHSKELRIIVTKGGSSSKAQNNNSQKNTSKKNNPNFSNGLFIKATVSNFRPYVGEHLVATYKLYFNYDIAENSYKTLPSLTGFWSEDLDLKKNRTKAEVIKGVRFNVVTLKKSVLIPQRSGDLIIDPFEMDLVIRQPVQSRSRNIFDQFFGNYKTYKVTIASAPLVVKVKALPSGRPAGFNGAVGKYKFEFKADRNDVKANEAINFSYVISGSGNLKLLNKPEIEFPSDFEVYDPKVNDRISVNANGMSGTRTYTYLSIPRHNGTFTIDPVVFSYFDTQKEKYITLKSPQLIFNILKGEDDDGNTVTFRHADKEEVKLLGSDIRFIKTNTILIPTGYSFFGTHWYYILWLLPIPLFFLALFLKKKNDLKRSDLVYMKKSKANKMAIKRLSMAKKHIADGDDKRFYEEIFKALYGFFEDKFNINHSEISKDKIRESLESAGLSMDIINNSEDILNKCEMARFAPLSDISHEKIYEEAVSVLSAIQKSIK